MTSNASNINLNLSFLKHNDLVSKLNDLSKKIDDKPIFSDRSIDDTYRSEIKDDTCRSELSLKVDTYKSELSRSNTFVSAREEYTNFESSPFSIYKDAEVSEFDPNELEISYNDNVNV